MGIQTGEGVRRFLPANLGLSQRMGDSKHRMLEDALFTTEELKAAVSSLQNKKAPPGPDGIPAEVMKAVTNVNTHLLLDMCKCCLLYTSRCV